MEEKKEVVDEKEFEVIKFNLFPLIYLIMSVPELVSFFHTEDFFDESFYFLITIQEIMDTIRRIYSPVFKIEERYNMNTIKSTHCPTFSKIQFDIKSNSSEKITQHFFEQLHLYLTSKKDSSNIKCEENACLAHSLFNICLLESKMNKNFIFPDPDEVNEFIYHMDSSLFKEKFPLSHFRHFKEKGTYQTKKIETKNYLVIWLYHSCEKGKEMNKERFRKMLQDSFTSNDLATEKKQVDKPTFVIRGVVYENQFTKQCSLYLREIKAKGWTLFLNNTVIGSSYLGEVVSSIASLANDKFKPIMLIAERTAQ